MGAPSPTKVCVQCGKEKHVDCFAHCRIRKSGVKPKCRECVNAYQRDHYHKKYTKHKVKPPEGFKRCCRCHGIYKLDEFYLTRTGVRYNYCNPCGKEYRRRENIKNRKKLRNAALAKYGLDCDTVDKMISDQDGVCFLCGRPPEQAGRKGLHVDHDHSSGKVRAMLCCHCNQGLGHFRDDPALIERAAGYLRLWREESIDYAI